MQLKGVVGIFKISIDIHSDHSFYFVDPETDCHTNRIESLWLHVKAMLPTHHREGDFQYYLSNYLFKKYCKEVDCFSRFLEIVRETGKVRLSSASPSIAVFVTNLPPFTRKKQTRRTYSNGIRMRHLSQDIL